MPFASVYLIICFLIGKVYLWVCRANKTLPKIHGLKKMSVAKYDTERLIIVDSETLASLQENGLYLLRILFEIGNFFFLLPLIACLN